MERQFFIHLTKSQIGANAIMLCLFFVVVVVVVCCHCHCHCHNHYHCQLIELLTTFRENFELETVNHCPDVSKYAK